MAHFVVLVLVITGLSLLGHLLGHKGAASGLPACFLGCQDHHHEDHAAPPGEGRYYPEE